MNNWIKTRPFILSTFRGFLTKEYGVKGEFVYEKTDFAGMFQTGYLETHLSNIGTPSYHGLIIGSVKFPGVMGHDTIIWKNVWLPAKYVKRINEIKKKGNYGKQRFLSPNKVIIFIFSLLIIAILIGLLNS